MPIHAFVDESKVRGLIVVAAVLEPRDLATARRTMRSPLLPRQTHVHFVKERSSRKAQIADAIAELPLRFTVYDASAINDQRLARQECLERLVFDLAQLRAHRLVIEQDDSLVRSDQQVLYRAVRRNQVQDVLTYEHLPARSEPLLWIPDVVAWCWTAGGLWHQRVEPLLGEVVALWTARSPAHPPSGRLPGPLHRRYCAVQGQS